VRFVGALYFRVFEPLLAFGRETRLETTRALRAARIGFFPEWYLSLAYFSAAAAALLGWTVLGALLALLVPGGALLKTLLVVGLGLSLGLVVYLGFLLYPRVKAASRARAIDEELPNVITLCYALARGGLSCMSIFRAVAEEEQVYGEVSREFGLIVRDMDWFGEDINTALLATASTTPSDALRRFLEGLVTVLNSGAAPRDYFKRQAEMQLQQAELRLVKDQEQTALLAEVYVSGLLVMPLLLIVVLSVLASLGGDGARYLPLIAFGLIPLGTVGYLVLLDLLAPQEPLSVPRRGRARLVDAGLEGIPTAEAEARSLKRILRAEAPASPEARRLRRGLAAEALRGAFQRFRTQVLPRALEKPLEAAQVAGAAGLTVLALGVGYLLLFAEDGYGTAVALASVLLAAALVAGVPSAIVHEWRYRRALRIDAALPETLRKVAGLNERGITLLQAFQIIGRGGDGPVAESLRRLDRDVAWTSNFRGAIARMAEAVGTRRMLKLGVLFERASEATGNLKEVVDIAATDVAATENLRARKRQAMMSYVVVIYAVFGVFLYVVYMVTTLFFAEGGFAAAALETSSSGLTAGSGGALVPAEARVLFFQTVLLQAVCCGLVAGRLGEGQLLSGLKHAAILASVAWIVFYVGVV